MKPMKCKKNIEVNNTNECVMCYWLNPNRNYITRAECKKENEIILIKEKEK